MRPRLLCANRIATSPPRMADDVDAQVRLNELVETSRNKPDLVVQGERCPRVHPRVIAIAAEVERYYTVPTGHSLGQRRPLRL